VLWALVLLSIIAVSWSFESRTGARIARNMADNAAARAAADAGIQRVIFYPGKFRADGTVYNWRFANSTVHLSVQDELAKINLNKAPEAALGCLDLASKGRHDRIVHLDAATATKALIMASKA
jgi:general secretion pathway protein K